MYKGKHTLTDRQNLSFVDDGERTGRQYARVLHAWDGLFYCKTRDLHKAGRGSEAVFTVPWTARKLEESAASGRPENGSAHD